MHITRQTLFADIASWSDRPDLAGGNRIESILRVTENMIDNTVRPQGQVQSVTLAAPASVPLAGGDITVVPLPEDAVKIQSVAVSGATGAANFVQPDSTISARFVPPGAFGEIVVSQGSRLGYVYSFIDSAARFYPALGVDTPVNIVYHARIPRLTAENPSNELLENSYFLYLYAGLTATGVFLQDPQLEATYRDRFAVALSDYNRMETRKYFPSVVEDIRYDRVGTQP